MDNLQRPDGSVATPIGWILIVVGLIGIFVGATAETFSGKLMGFGLANLGIGLGVLLLSLGYLVRAIWFLPGREISAEESTATPLSAASSTSCNWCGRTLPKGAVTCTALSHEQLVKVGPTVLDAVCQRELNKRGYRP